MNSGASNKKEEINESLSITRRSRCLYVFLIEIRSISLRKWELKRNWIECAYYSINFVRFICPPEQYLIDYYLYGAIKFYSLIM